MVSTPNHLIKCLSEIHSHSLERSRMYSIIMRTSKDIPRLLYFSTFFTHRPDVLTSDTRTNVFVRFILIVFKGHTV